MITHAFSGWSVVLAVDDKFGHFRWTRAGHRGLQFKLLDAGLGSKTIALPPGLTTKYMREQRGIYTSDRFIVKFESVPKG